MCRFSRTPLRFTGVVGLALAGLLVAFVAVTPVAADEVAVFLERNGLTELLAVHLEDQLESAKGEEEAEILVRLASIYAELLETLEDPARRSDLEQRSRQLLTRAPAGETDELRYALLRASYRSAEKIAENHRLRLSTDEEVERAKAMFAEIIPELNNLRRQTSQRAELLERRLIRASGADAILVSQKAEKVRALDSQCQFLAAWALYYRSWFEDEPAYAKIAKRHFAELLDFGEQAALPGNVTVDLRSTEAIARCILGTALCESLASSSLTALSWLVLLDHEQTYPPLREQVPVWTMAILLEHGEYLRVQQMLVARADEGKELPLPWLRLVAVNAITGAQRSRYAADLASFAVTLLAARGELGQVFDLADRFGAEALGDSGFALRYVGGVLRYHEAREAHGNDEPTGNDTVRGLYGEAATELEAAREESDAARYPAALPDCTRLIAWCAYFRGEFRRARDAFEVAARELPAEAAPEALWMAIVSLDKLVASDPDNAILDDQLAGLVARFLAEYPSSEHAPKLILRRALTSREVSPELAEELLAIPENSEVYESARRRASQILYRLFRDASGGQRIAYGNKYLSITYPIHVREEENQDWSDPLAGERFLVRGRRILEVALYAGIERLVAARAVLASFDEMTEKQIEVDDEFASELDYRRLQERLIAGSVGEAENLADRIWEAAPDGPWSRRASRAMFRFANERRKDADLTLQDNRRAVARVVKYGARVLAEYADDPQALDDVRVLSWHATVADASMVIWQRSGDAAQGKAALAIFERLLAARPRNARFLRSTALLAGKLGKPEVAIECWRTLIAGTNQGSDAWFEARFELINLLAIADPDRARLVLEQHRQLNPDYGPDPWGTRIREIDKRLGRGGDESSPAPAPGAGPPLDAGGAS